MAEATRGGETHPDVARAAGGRRLAGDDALGDERGGHGHGGHLDVFRRRVEWPRRASTTRESVARVALDEAENARSLAGSISCVCFPLRTVRTF